MAGPQLGVVAAGHPLTARAGADVLRDGGNAVDAALGGDARVVRVRAAADRAGRRRLHAGRRARRRAGAAGLLRRGARARRRPARRTASSMPIDVSFGDAIQVFNIGAASVGTYGVPAGLCEAAAALRPRAAGRARRRPAARLARDGVELNPQQAYVVEILGGIVTATPECRALFAPEGRVLRAGRADPPAGARRRARAARRGGLGAVLHGRHRRRDRRVAGRRGRAAHGRGPGRLRGGRARAGPRRATAGARC